MCGPSDNRRPDIFMKKNKIMMFLKRYRIYLFVIILSILIWFGDSIIDAIFFYNEPFENIAFLKIPYFEYYFRFSLIALMIVIGFIAARRERDKKRAKNALDTERRQMLTIFDSINQPIYIIDPETHELLYTNKALRDIYGEETKKKCYEYFLDYSSVCSKCFMPEVRKLDFEKVYPREFYNEKTGRYFGCIDRKMTWVDGREVIYTFSIDITEQKKIEVERSRVNKFETMEILADTLVHDFNNLLTTMIMSISVAKNYSVNMEKVSSLLGMAEDAAYRAKDITHRLLTFTKNSEPQFELVDFRKIMKETTDFVLKESGILYDLQIEKNLPDLYIDVGQIVQVVNNLLINARQAVSKDGMISVRMYTAETTALNEGCDKFGRYVCISVKDNGEGISRKNLEKIFTPYFTTKSEGLGLGLASCYSIVGKHDGMITVDSKHAEGTEFKVYLPVKDVSAEKKQEYSENVDESVRILLVEDDELVGSVTGLLIKHLGYKADVENDETRAVDIFKHYAKQKDPVKIVMIDLTAPHNVSPKELLNRFKVIDPQIRSILTSGIDNEAVMKEYTDYGFNAVLMKPFRTQDIVSAVNKALL